jgi:hypothetical protein
MILSDIMFTGVKPIDMIENPGPLSPEEARKYFEVKQRSPRMIDRLNHPELHLGDSKRGWKYGDGDWGSHRLNFAEADMTCDIDQYYADEITSDEIFEKYLARSAPVIIRGMLNEWPMVNASSRHKLRELHGHVPVLVSNIPYADKFGGEGERLN